MSSPDAERAADPAMVRAAVARVAENGDVEERETHISHLFLTTDRAFKLKKPLTLDFLDYRTAARRKAMCLEEVRLNSRLAPSLYLGVRALVAGQDGLEFAEADVSGAIDYVVEMRRYDEDQTLSAALARGDLDTREVERLGDKLAAFHANCRPVRVEGGARRAGSLIESNLREFPEPPPSSSAPSGLSVPRALIRTFARRNCEVLDRRADRGQVRECHGDLRAEHVILRPELSVVDCVEFALDLRTLVRKELAGLRPQERAPAEVYSPEFSRRTYRDLGRRAALALDDGACVVVDATFRRRDDRAAFSDTFGNQGRVVFVQCLAPAHVVAKRASARELGPGRVSDATVEIAQREGLRWDPLDEIEPGSRIALSTHRDGGQVVTELAEGLEQCLAGGGHGRQ